MDIRYVNKVDPVTSACARLTVDQAVERCAEVLNVSRGEIRRQFDAGATVPTSGYNYVPVGYTS